MSEPERRKRDDFAASLWKEKELLDGKTVDAGVIILRTSGCGHFHAGGCSMCGYNVESSGTVTGKDIEKQYTRAIEQLGDVDFLKVYTSGSFLDECEVPAETADLIIHDAAEKGMRLLFETRPEFVKASKLDRIGAITDNLEIALGLESSNDRVLKYSINKGFTVRDYDDAAKSIHDSKMDIRTYVLLKPPFLTEAEAIADAKATVQHAARSSKTISLNPVNVQKGTLVEKLWRNWAYRPPWLWSVLDVIKESKGLESRVVCDPTGGGMGRGAHNCGDCDEVILDSIKAFSLSQDCSRLGAPECECKELWNSIMDVERLIADGAIDLQRFFARPRKRR